jgi:hypothetical protein
MLASLAIFLFGPVRRWKSGVPLSDQLAQVIAPALRYQLRLINSDANLHTSPRTLYICAVLISAPLFSIGVALAAWTAALFWLYTTILGEPNQREGKEVDGKSAARWVRRLWERWLLYGFRS